MIICLLSFSTLLADGGIESPRFMVEIEYISGEIDTVYFYYYMEGYYGECPADSLFLGSLISFFGDSVEVFSDYYFLQYPQFEGLPKFLLVKPSDCFKVALKEVRRAHVLSMDYQGCICGVAMPLSDGEIDLLQGKPFGMTEAFYGMEVIDDPDYAYSFYLLSYNSVIGQEEILNLKERAERNLPMIEDNHGSFNERFSKWGNDMNVFLENLREEMRSKNVIFLIVIA